MSQIHTILTHRDPDMDEVEAIRLLKRYGENTYLGISKAEIVTVAKRDFEGKKAETLELEGVLCVGIGGGKFDEHPFGERGRREGECAATLVAKDLGLESNPNTKINIAYALAKNYSAETWEFEIAPLEKLAFRYLTHSEDENKNKEMEKKIFDACFLLLDAAEANETYIATATPTPQIAHKSMQSFVRDWMQKRFGYTESKDQIFYWIQKYGRKHPLEDDGKQETSFDLVDLATLAQRFSYPNEAIEQSVEIFLDAIWNKYKNFFVNCRNDYNSNTTRVATIKRDAENLFVTSVVSSNPEIAKYCRSEYGKYSAVVIKRDPNTGNSQIFFNQKYGLDPKPIARELRIAERMSKGLTEELDSETLVSQGKIAGAEEWYFDGFQLLNGSHTAEEVPTHLSREEVEKAVMRGLRSIQGII